MDSCFSCGLREQLDFICLACNVLLHDRCIGSHRDATPSKTHSIIPHIGNLVQISTGRTSTEAPLAEKVKVCGSGVMDGHLDSFQGTIDVDTSEAGPGDLGVRITGPSVDNNESFCVNMKRDLENKCLIHCSYKPTTSGKYTIRILWSDIDVPGSPFTVNISNE